MRGIDGQFSTISKLHCPKQNHCCCDKRSVAVEENTVAADVGAGDEMGVEPKLMVSELVDDGVGVGAGIGVALDKEKKWNWKRKTLKKQQRLLVSMVWHEHSNHSSN